MFSVVAEMIAFPHEFEHFLAAFLITAGIRRCVQLPVLLVEHHVRYLRITVHCSVEALEAISRTIVRIS